MPGNDQQRADLPPGSTLPAPYVFEDFAGINTAAVRAGVPDNQIFWADGFMPIAARNLRTLPDVGTSIYTASNGVVTLGTIAGGSGGSGGPFTNVSLTGGSGSGAQATVTLSGGAVSSVVITAEGDNYKVGDVLSAASGNIGGVTGFSVPVTTIATIAAPPFFFVLEASNAIVAALYCALLLSDGSVVAVNVSTQAATTILPAGTIKNPSPTNIGFTQYDEEYLIIVASLTSGNGYFIWDGNLLYQAGSLGPVVTLTNAGSGYYANPTATVGGGTITGATAVASINNSGNVDNIVLTNPGSGALPGQTITITCSGGNRGGSGGSLTAVLTNTGSGSGASINAVLTASSFPFEYFISGFTINDGGSGYSEFTTLFTTSNGKIDQQAVLQPVIIGGIITGITIISGGIYAVTPGGPPTVSIVASDSGGYVVSSVTINNGGSDYSPSAIATASSGGDPVTQATFELILTSGVITDVVVLNGGLYGSNTAPSVSVTDAAVNATATVALMPFGIQGTCINTYDGFILMADGPNIYGSAPGSVTDFATGDGGISFTSNSSNIKSGYSAIVVTNGYAYFVGDSSVDYMSGLTTSGSPPTTEYTFLNVDPEVGTPYPSSVLTFGNLFLLGNAIGVYVCAGSTLTKISDALDGSGLPNGLWNSVADFDDAQLSSAKATIFSRKVWIILVPVIDPISGDQVNKLFIWDSKVWWASQQSVPLLYIAASEYNSVLTAYGTDGTKLYPLFQQPGTGFTKTVQSKLFDAPGYAFIKAPNRLWGMSYVFNSGSPTFDVAIDTEAGPMETPYTFTPSDTGYYIWPPTAIGQQGVLNGFTISTNAADMALISVSMAYTDVAFRG